jgi:hypothetical protein
MLYRCSPNNNVIEFNLAYRNGKFVAAYTVNIGTKTRFIYSILDNGSCLNTTAQDESDSVYNTALEFFNDTHIALAWFRETTGAQKTIYKEVNLRTGFN